MFIRVKNIRSNNGDMHPYYYLVENVWTKKGSRQKVKKYLEPAKQLGVLKKETIDFLYSFFDYKCGFCGSTKNLTIEHSTSFRKGGTNHIFNIQIVCRSCNMKKGKQILETPHLTLLKNLMKRESQENIELKQYLDDQKATGEVI